MLVLVGCEIDVRFQDMPTYNDYGIVLNSYNFAEADKILNIYTKENGLVRAIGKGVRKSTSKYGSKVDQLSCCYFQFAKGKNLDILCDLEQINSFLHLRSTLSRLSHAILFLDIVSNFAHEKESESNYIYELLYVSLDKLQVANNPDLLLVKFILNFLAIHGYKPQLKTCVSCSTEVPEYQGADVDKELVVYPYSSVLGGLLCTSCAKQIDNQLVSTCVLVVLALVDNCSLDLISLEPVALSDSVFKSDNVRLVLQLLREHLSHRAKSDIKSFELVFSL